MFFNCPGFVRHIVKLFVIVGVISIVIMTVTVQTSRAYDDDYQQEKHYSSRHVTFYEVHDSLLARVFVCLFAEHQGHWDWVGMDAFVTVCQYHITTQPHSYFCLQKYSNPSHIIFLCTCICMLLNQELEEITGRRLFQHKYGLFSQQN